LFKTDRRPAALAALLLALLFAADIIYVRSSRTAFVTLPVLLMAFGMRLFGWRGLAGTLAIGLVGAAIAFASSPYLRARTTSVFTEIRQYRTDNAMTSSGERLEFWKKSLRFIAEAPIIGHGTGSIPGMFRSAVVGGSGASSEATANPHNQTFAVGIQLGILGMALLWAMWAAHVLLFTDDGFVAWFGLVVVVNSIVGSLFNSHLSDFTQGWVYVVLVGAAGGAVLRGRQRPVAGHDVS
jgi:O-antigen ligase